MARGRGATTGLWRSSLAALVAALAVGGCEEKVTIKGIPERDQQRVQQACQRDVSARLGAGEVRLAYESPRLRSFKSGNVQRIAGTVEWNTVASAKGSPPPARRGTCTIFIDAAGDSSAVRCECGGG